MKKVYITIIVYNLDHTLYGIYSGIVETAKNIGCSIKIIWKSLNSPSKLLKKH